MEILPSEPQIPGFFSGVRCGPIQVTGGIHLYEREPSKVQPAQPSAPKIQHLRSPTPMDMEEKLIRLERFAIYERNLYRYSEEKGIYVKIDRDAAKEIIRDRLEEDLRVRGTANQINEIYEFLRLDKGLKVNSPPPKHLLAFTNGVLNLRTGVFTAGHSPDLFLTWRLEIPYQAGNHSCPMFDSVVQQISSGDPVFIARVSEVLGYLLVPSSFMKGIVLFQGLSGAGKSVLSRLIATYFDPSIVAHIAVALFENRFAPATLEGCRLSSQMLRQVLPLVIAVFIMMTSTESASLSLEGKSRWLMCSLPVRSIDIFHSKNSRQSDGDLPVCADKQSFIGHKDARIIGAGCFPVHRSGSLCLFHIGFGNVYERKVSQIRLDE